MPGQKKKKFLGEILKEHGVITESQLDEVLKISKSTNQRIGNVLVDKGYATDEDVATALAEQYDIPSVMLSKMVVDPDVARRVPEPVAKRYKVVAYDVDGSTIKLAMLDPLNVLAIDEVRRITNSDVTAVVTTETEITTAIDRVYGMSASLEEIARDIQAAGAAELTRDEEEAPEKLEKLASENSVIQLVNSLIGQAVTEGASDIHIEPDDEAMRIRLRVDGVLHDSASFPRGLHSAVISRLKILGELDIAEKRIPQDGRFFIRSGSKEIDIRLSTLPTIFGEKAVMRLLDKSTVVLELEHMTPMPDVIKTLEDAIRRPYGIILITGPTGSGKTTTAYTLLSRLNTPEKNLVTVEDPVEFHIKRINQVPVNPKTGVTFAAALRHILRQDPDVVLIGEIRDRETAEIAVHAALTGHLVISTIHTNDAVGTITRLTEMGIEPYLISSAITCIVAQRLVRRICTNCKVGYEVTPELLDELGVKVKPGSPKPQFFKGTGCPACKNTGLKGRIGIFELLVPNEEIRALMLAKADGSAIVEAAKKVGFKTLRMQGIRTAAAGHTTIEEVLQATQSID